MAVVQSVAGNVQVTKNTLAQPYLGVTPLLNGSGNAANQEAKTTLTPSATTCAYLCGVIVSGGGATVPLPVLVTITGLLGGPRQFVYCFNGAPKEPNVPLNLSFDPPLPAEAINTPIVVTCPPSGSGGTHNGVFAWGFASTLPEGGA